MTRGDTKRALGQFGAGLGALLRVRWIRWIAILAAGLLLLRAGLTRLLAMAVDQAVEPHGLTCEWDRLSVGFFGVNGSVRDLALRPRDDAQAEALVELEYAVFDVDTWALFAGELHVVRAEVDGLDLLLERDEEGVWNLEEYLDVEALLAAASAPPEEDEEDEEPEPEPEAPTAHDLTLPIDVGALRFQAARLSVIDHYLDPPVELDLRLNAALSKLGDYDRPTRFGVTVTGGDVLYGASFDGTLRATPERLDVRFKALLGSLQPRELQPYLSAIGVEAAAQTLQAGARGKVAVEVVGEARDALAFELELDDVALRADGAEEFAIDALSLRIDSISEDLVELAPVKARGTRGVIELREDGALLVAGLALLPKPVTLKPAGAEPVVPEVDVNDVVETVDDEVPDETGALLRIGGLELAEAELTLIDNGTAPAAVLRALCKRIEVGPVELGPGAADDAVRVVAQVSIPGIADDASVQAELDLRGDEHALRMIVEASGVALSAIDPYIAGTGVERSLADGTFRVATVLSTRLADDGLVHAELDVTDLALRGDVVERGDDATVRPDELLFALARLRLRDAYFDPASQHLRLGALELGGVASQLELEAGGSLAALGLRFGVPADRPGAPSDAAAEAAAGSPVAATSAQPRPRQHPLASWFDFPSLRAALPPLEIGRISMTETDLEFLDGTTTPPTRLAFDELGFELRELVLGLPAGEEATPATLEVRVALAGLLEELTLDGSVLVRPGDVDVDARVDVAARGVNGAPLRPYLEPLGITPVLESGTANLTFQTRVREIDGGVWAADATIEALRLADADGTWVGLERLELRELVAGRGRLDLARLAIDGPFARVEREAEGALRLAGVRVAPAGDASAGDAADADVPAATSAPADAGSAFVLPELPPVEIAELRVDAVRLQFEDAAFDPPLEVELGLDLGLQRVNTLGEPIDLDVVATIPGVIRALEFDSRLQLVDQELTVEGTFGARRLDPERLAGLLPPGLELETREAELDGALAISARAADGGGFAGRVAVSDVRWGEPGSDSWFELDSAVFEGRRLDPLAKLYEFGELQVRGTRVRARRDESGAIQAMGARLALAEAAAPTPAEAAAAATPAGIGTIEASATPPADEAPPAAEEPTAVSPKAPRKLVAPPTIRLAEGASFELERFEFLDALLDPDRPTIAGGVRLDLGAGELINPDPFDLAPTTWGLEGDLDGLVERWTLTGESAHFLPEPRHSLAFDARGVRLQGVIERVPALQGLAVGEFESGQLQAKLETVLFLQRGRPYELGFERAFGGQVILSEAYLRDEPEGQILLGVDEVAVQAKRILPDGSLVHLESVDVETPRMELWRDAEGLHVAGLVVPLPDLEAESSEAESSEPEAGASPEAVSPPVAAAEPPTPEGPSTGADDPAAGEPLPELRIDKLFVGGLDLHVVDSQVEPPLDAHFRDFDLEVSRFTTRALTERRVVSYRVFLATGNPSGEPVLLEEAATMGRLALHPSIEGWGRTQLVGLDLTQLSGYARPFDVEIRDGLLDLTSRTDAKNERLQVELSLLLHDLSVKEKSGGPIERVLKLPMSLENALFLTRSPDGTHRIGVDIGLTADGLSLANVLTQTTGAIAVFFASALAGAPVRLLTSVAPMADSQRDEPPIEVVEIPFRPGRTRFDDETRAELTRVARRVADRDDLEAIVIYVGGDEDLTEAEELANPSEAECLELVAQLRRRRSELWRAIGERKLEARALFAIDSSKTPELVEEMRAMERKLAELERSMDRVLAVLDGSSPRQRERRTAKVMRELGELRMLEIERALKSPLRVYEYDQLEFKPVRVRSLEEGAPSQVRIELRRR